MNDVMEYPYFHVSENCKFNAEPITEVAAIDVFYDKKKEGDMIGENSINLAKFSGILKKYNAQIDILTKKDEDGRSGIRLLDKQLMTLIDENQSSFKSMQLPKADQVDANETRTKKQRRARTMK